MEGADTTRRVFVIRWQNRSSAIMNAVEANVSARWGSHIQYALIACIIDDVNCVSIFPYMMGFFHRFVMYAGKT